MTNRRDLFPPIEPYRAGQLKLDARHTMYWEQSGNPRGEPVLFLHGGPGAGATPAHRRFFDPAHYRIVIFDQRGGGPLDAARRDSGTTRTAHLVADIERLRAAPRHRALAGVRRLVGLDPRARLCRSASRAGCAGFILRGIFLCRRARSTGSSTACATVFPEAWRAFAGFLPEDERGDLLAAYYRRLIDPDPRVHMPAARAWSVYEGACSTLLPSPETVRGLRARTALALGLARIEAHYFTHEHLPAASATCSTTSARIRHMPGASSCRAATTWCARSAAPTNWRAPGREAEYTIVPDAGHSAMEPGIRAQLVLATERAKRW